jgi:DNA-binding MarR family transcriptional regulator
MKSRAESLEQLIWEVRRVFRELSAAADRELQAIGVSAGDRAFLEFLAREKKPISLSDLARKYSVSRQHIHQRLRELPNPEWVDEIADAADGRTVLLRLSQKGRAHWNKIREVDRAFLSKLARRLAQERLASATDLLRQLRRELSPGKEIRNEQE